MTEAEFKEQLQGAQDLVDSLTDQRNNALNGMAQINAMRRNEARLIEALKGRVAELEDALAKLAIPSVGTVNGADASPGTPPA